MSSSFDLSTYLSETRDRFNPALYASISALPHPSRVVDAMHYSLQAGGKRLRPILCLATSALYDVPFADAVTAACAIECVHTYSLIHDDLPAMDDDDLRRGKPTCHAAFDEATAVLAGDALLTEAFYMLANYGMTVSAPDPVAGRTYLEIIQILAHASGHHGMIDGQMRDMCSEKQTIDLASLETLHRMKTGMLIRAAIDIGAIIGQADADDRMILSEYGDCIGLAFQVIDDILNVEGDPDVLGKSVGTDADRGKATYPEFIGLAASKQHAQDLVNRALQALAKFDTKADPLRGIATYILKRNR
ncbi:MAG: farnesyl-diphosphate synthase [Deltaproteobacteria bacterium]|nr:MAG: farnesyl-diphosphate synthase [Deltaproteobacteria bacterium]